MCDVCLGQCCSVLLYFLGLLVKCWVRIKAQSIVGVRAQSWAKSGPGLRLSLRPWLYRAQSMVGIRDQTGTMSRAWFIANVRAWSGVRVRPQSWTTVGVQSRVIAQFVAGTRVPSRIRMEAQSGAEIKIRLGLFLS